MATGPGDNRAAKTSALSWSGRIGLSPAVNVLIVFGLMISMAAFLVARHFDTDRVRQILELRADWRASDFDDKLNSATLTVGNLAAFLSATTPIAAGDFHRFVRKQQSATPVRSLNWVPYVRHDDLPAFLTQARLSGHPDFQVLARDSAGELQPSGVRRDYCPIWLSERFANQRMLTGLDLCGDPSLSHLMAAVRDNGMPTATSSALPSNLRPPSAFYQVIWPVYEADDFIPYTREERIKAFSGYAVGNFSIQAMLRIAIVDTPAIVERIYFYLDVPVAGDAPSPIAVYSPESGFDTDAGTGLTEGEVVMRHFNLLDHRWTLAFVFPPAHVTQLRSWAPWWVLTVCLLLTALLSYYVAQEQWQRRQIEILVADRTQELTKINDTLNIEIEERQYAQKALQEQAETLAAVLATLPVGIIHFNPRKNILFWSRATEQIFDYPAMDVLGEPFSQIVEEEQAEFDALLDEIIAGRIVQNHMLHGLRKDKTLLTISFSGAALYDRGTLRGIVGVLEDFTGRQLLEAQLQQSQKMEALGQLTGGMAHDFNNLLMVVMGNLQLVEDLADDRPDIKDFASDAYRAAERGADLIRSLLAFARRQPLRPRSVNIGEVVADIVKLLKRVLGENIDVKVEDGHELWPVIIDPVQLESALTNLATNARDAMPRGGRLTIATRNTNLDDSYATQHPDVKPGDYVMLQVSDTGSGMTAEVLEHIFEPFFTTKDRGRGTGLGLAMVFGFMKQSGGHINVYSEVDVGTTFRLYLPRQHSVTEVETVESKPELAKGNNETILVVEDDADIRKLVVLTLGTLGYRTIEADNASKALSLLEGGQHIDLVLSDIVMAGKLDGLDLAQIVPKKWPQVKIVLTSGFPDTKMGEELDTLTNVRLLSKPYRRAELAAVLRSVLDGESATGD